jgi:hypothetical protein
VSFLNVGSSLTILTHLSEHSRPVSWKRSFTTGCLIKRLNDPLLYRTAITPVPTAFLLFPKINYTIPTITDTMKYLLFSLALFIGTAVPVTGQDSPQSNETETDKLSLITATPDEGFALAIQLARKGVTSTQSDREILFELREKYATDPDALIASSQVIAIHFQTIAAANNYWRNPKEPCHRAID